MKLYPGKSINSGSSAGPVFILKEENTDKEENTETGSRDESYMTIEPKDTQAEKNRLADAVSSVIEDLNKTGSKVGRSGGQITDDIINSHIMVLKDDTEDSFISKAHMCIDNKSVSAENAVSMAASEICAQFRQSASDYLKARCEDILHLKKMIINKLAGGKECGIETGMKKPSILVADELSPETLVSIDPDMLLGIVTRNGSALSHTAIIARNMDKPYLSGVNWNPEDVESEMMGAIDGSSNSFVVNPDDETLNRISMQIDKDKTRSPEETVKLVDKCPIRLYANIGSVAEAENAEKWGAKGVGLFRTEFLFMDRDDIPSEEEQYEAYSKVAAIMGPDKPVTIRTIDIGADKAVRCLPVVREDDPTLGTRGIGISLKYPELFKIQLRAILRASTLGNVRVMFPMIANEEEILKAKEAINEAALELKNEDIPYAVPKIGIMVETPSAAVNIEKIAPLVDFVSIGTNDLTQYTLGLDRMNEKLSDYYDSHHPAVMSLIRMIAEGARKVGVEVGICGEMAADKTLGSDWAAMGIDELSMSPVKLGAVAAAILEGAG